MTHALSPNHLKSKRLVAIGALLALTAAMLVVYAPSAVADHNTDEVVAAVGDFDEFHVEEPLGTEIFRASSNTATIFMSVTGLTQEKLDEEGEPTGELEEELFDGDLAISMCANHDSDGNPLPEDAGDDPNYTEDYCFGEAQPASLLFVSTDAPGELQDVEYTLSADNIGVEAGQCLEGGNIPCVAAFALLDGSLAIAAPVFGGPGFFGGAVVDAETGLPIEEATVEADDGEGVVLSTTTEEDGSYQLGVPTGTYDVTADAEGFDPQTFPDQTADPADGPTVLIFQLEESTDPIITDVDPLAGRDGDTVSVQGAFFTPSTTAVAELCDSDLENCEAMDNSTLSTNAEGDLTGTVDVPVGATTGDRMLQVTDTEGVQAASSFRVLGDPEVTLSPNAGSPGTTTTATGEDFDPNTDHSVFVHAIGDDPSTAGELVTDSATSDDLGAVTQSVTITEDDVIAFADENEQLAVTIENGDLSATATFTARTGCTVLDGQDDCDAVQTIELEVIGLDLSMEFLDPDVTEKGPGSELNENATTINMTPVTLSGEDELSEGQLNTVRIRDLRGTLAGWTVTGDVTPLVTDDSAGDLSQRTIETDDIRWVNLQCEPVDDADGGQVTPGPGGIINSNTTLCEAGAGGGGGIFDADAVVLATVRPGSVHDVVSGLDRLGAVHGAGVVLQRQQLQAGNTEHTHRDDQHRDQHFDQREPLLTSRFHHGHAPGQSVASSAVVSGRPVAATLMRTPESPGRQRVSSRGVPS